MPSSRPTKSGLPFRGWNHPPGGPSESASIPDRQRAALVLRYIEDLSQADVAERMDIAVGTASATLSQAKGNLRSELVDEDQP